MRECSDFYFFIIKYIKINDILKHFKTKNIKICYTIKKVKRYYYEEV